MIAEPTIRIPNPAGWPVHRLGDLCDLISRGSAPVYVDNSDILAIGQRCVTAGGFDARVARAHSTRARTGLLIAESGDVLLNSTGTGTIGRSCVFAGRGTFMVDGHVTVLRQASTKTDGRWLNAVLRSSWGQAFLETQCYSGSTNQVELSRTRLVEGSVPTPPILEQRKMAEILDTLDDAIRRTEEIIAKLKQVKQGLLHDLLTRGIDDNGELRDPIRHPEQFKDSPVGRIPRAWEAIPLRQCLTSNPTNGIYKPGHLIGRGVLLVGQTAFTEERSIDPDAARRAVVTQGEVERYGITHGDILVSRVFATTEGVGQPALVPELPEPAVYESNMMRLRPDRSMIRPEVLFSWLRTRQLRAILEARVNASNQASINQRELNSLPVVRPQMAEQGRIVGSIAACDIRRNDERKTLDKLRLLKTGLMDDLLTGRVRVTPLLEHPTP